MLLSECLNLGSYLLFRSNTKVEAEIIFDPLHLEG